MRPPAAPRAVCDCFCPIFRTRVPKARDILYKENEQLKELTSVSSLRKRARAMNSDFIVAVHALVFLNHKQSVVSSEALAENVCTNAARVRKVMAPLKRAGLVETREGNEGGYRFVGDAAAIDLASVADALDVRFVEARWHSGDVHKECLVASGMGGIMDDLFADLDAECRERLKQVTIASIDRRIFGAQTAEGTAVLPAAGSQPAA